MRWRLFEENLFLKAAGGIGFWSLPPAAVRLRAVLRSIVNCTGLRKLAQLHCMRRGAKNASEVHTLRRGPLVRPYL